MPNLNLDRQQRTRRRFLNAAIGVGIVGTAGCSGLSGDRSNDLDTQLTEKEDRIAALEEKLERRNTTIDELRAENQELKADVEALEQTIQQQNTTITDLESRAEDAQNEIVRLEQRIEDIEAETSEFSNEVLNTAKEVGLEARRAVVMVVGKSGLGTGFHIGDGYFMTNRHVVSDDAVGDSVSLDIFPELSIGTSSIEATLIGKTEDGFEIPDIALLKSSTIDIPSLTYKTATDMEVGQPLVLVGHPRSAGEWIISIGTFTDYTENVTSDYTPSDNEAAQFVSDIPARSRSSGSPTLTLDGEVVGILYASASGPVYKTAPEKVHTNLLDHPDYDAHVHSVIFDEYFSEWK